MDLYRMSGILLCVVLIHNISFGQDKKTKQVIPNDSTYQDNIKKSRLYGIYIPRDIDDALSKLMELTDEDARKPLREVSEDIMVKKLYFVLGRWREYNWHFEEGSRFSHYLRLKGLYYTEDMTRFMLTLFHRHINQKPLDSEKLIKTFIDQRSIKIKEGQSKMEIIHSEKKKNANN
ncbi:MAG: hypothetical protein IPO37_24130 [Saprospiraceae bacterium]|nr:hypothetical protein [Saprospiraceae bacterium]